MTPVQSSTIKAIGYDPASKTMAIEFNHGGLYQYADVPPETHKAFMEAKSIGNHFHVHIRPKHDGVKVVVPEPATPETIDAVLTK